MGFKERVSVRRGAGSGGRGVTVWCRASARESLGKGDSGELQRRWGGGGGGGRVFQRGRHIRRDSGQGDGEGGGGRGRFGWLKGRVVHVSRLGESV